MKRQLKVGVIIFLLAAGVRLIYLVESADNPSFTAPTVDSESYDVMAREWSGGQKMPREYFWQPFFYPFFLGLIYFLVSLVKASIITVKVMQVLLGAVTCGLTYHLGRKLFGKSVGIGAGIITALYGPLIFFEGELLASGWAAFWSVVLVLFFIKAGEEKNFWLCLVLGLCGGLSIITRPTFVLFFGAGVIWLGIVFYRKYGEPVKSTLRLVVVLLGLVLILLPVAALNRRVTGHFGFLPASGGINLYIGNNPDREATLTARPGWGWEEVATMPEQEGIVGDMWVQQSYFKEKFREYVFNRPGNFLKGLGYKTLQFISSREIPRNVNIYVMSKWSGILKILAWKAGGFGFPYGIILPLVLVGLFYGGRWMPGPIWLFVILYPLSVILVFVTARYRVAVIPIFAILAAAGGASLFRMVKLRQGGKVFTSIVIIIASAGLSIFPGPFPEEKPNYEAELYANVGSVLSKREQLIQAQELYHKALLLQPEYPILFANMAAVLAKLGRVEEALVYGQKAMDYKQDSPELHNTLAVVLARTGKTAEAEKHYKLALELQPDYAEAYYNYGGLLMSQGKNKQAIKILRAAVSYKQSYYKAYNDLAVALSMEDRYEEALPYFEQAVLLEPDNPQTRSNLGMALVRVGRIREAIGEFREALRQAPDSPILLNQLARILATEDEFGLRNATEAIWLAQRACELTGYQHPESLDTLAAAYAAGGKFSEAIETAQKAAELALKGKDRQLAAGIQYRLNLYKAGRDYGRNQLLDPNNP